MTEPEKEEVLSLLVYGPSKGGKSTLGSTGPTPILAIDAEGSWKFIRTVGGPDGAKLRKRTWDPTYPPPEHDGTWDLCVVNVANWGTMQQVYAWLTQATHPFATVVLDSITELQRRCKANIRSDSVLGNYQDWGKLLVDMDNLIRGFRDLTIRPGPVRVVLFVAELYQDKLGRAAPYMQGAIGGSLPYWVDICGYLSQSRVPDANGNATIRQVSLFIASNPNFVTGERVQGVLPDSLIQPNLRHMLGTIYPSEIPTPEPTSTGDPT